MANICYETSDVTRVQHQMDSILYSTASFLPIELVELLEPSLSVVHFMCGKHRFRALAGL